MKIASWNVNSLKVRLPHVLTWLESEKPDALGLQELKMEASVFPLQAFQEMGYQAFVLGQKTYNGVAWLIKAEHHVTEYESSIGFPNWPDSQARCLTLHLPHQSLMVWYVPNGQSVGSEKYLYKLEWLKAAKEFVEQTLEKNPSLIIVGDFNIAPADEDVYDPVAWGEGVLCSPPEREAWRQLLNLGLHDSFRLFEQAEKSYSWWDYRQGAFRRNQGLRIDHILISEAMKKLAKNCWIDTTPRQWERPSDHAPVVLELLKGV